MNKKDRQEMWDRWHCQGTIREDSHVVRMLQETAIALAVCKHMPKFSLATDALQLELNTLINIASARGISLMEGPGAGAADGEHLLKGLEK